MPMPYGIYIERCEKDRYAIRYDDEEYDEDRKLTGSCNLKSRDITAQHIKNTIHIHVNLPVIGNLATRR